MNRRVLVVVMALWAGTVLVSCGSSRPKEPPSGLTERVLASQGVSSATTFGGLVIVDAYNDTLKRVPELAAGNSPGLMAVSPTRNIAMAFDSSSNSVFAVNTTTESSMGHVQLPGPTSSMIIPTANPIGIGYAAVPSAAVIGYTFVGAVDVMNLTYGTIATTIAVSSAQTVVSNSDGTQLLVFSNDSDSLTVLFPQLAVPPVDTSCLNNPPNAVCDIIPGFSRPVYAVINGNTAYVMNCGLECGGSQPASVAVFDLGSLTITNTIPVDAATWAFLSGSTLYVAGTSPTDNSCTGQTWGIPPQPTAATHCGRLDSVNLGSMKKTSSYIITDGYHDRMDMSVNGQLFIGSYDCTNIGDVNNPSGEVRGCLSILNTTTNQVIVPANNGDVGGLQSFTSRYVEYVAENGTLWVYDTLTDAPLVTDYIPDGYIDIVGYVGDVKAIDFF